MWLASSTAGEQTRPSSDFRKQRPAQSCERERVASEANHHKSDLKANKSSPVRLKRSDFGGKLSLSGVSVVESARVNSLRDRGRLERLSFVTVRDSNYSLEAIDFDETGGYERQRTARRVLQADQSQNQPLPVGEPIERRLKGGESHIYIIELTEGQFLRIDVEEKGADVRVLLARVVGAQLIRAVTYGSGYDRETLSFIADRTESYAVLVVSPESSPDGNYRLTAEVKDAATAVDKERVEAERLLGEAWLSWKKGSAEGTKDAIAMFEQSLSLWKKLGETYWQGYLLNYLAGVYSDLGEKQKAIQHYEQALLLRKAADDKSGEAATLANIGKTYRSLDEKQKAIDYYQLALPLFKAIGNKSEEATMLNNIGLAYSEMGEGRRALDFYVQSLPVLRAIGARRREAKTLNNVMGAWESLGNRRLAIFFGKQAVNKYQELRGDAQGLDNETQKSFLRDVQDYYQYLAELLIKGEQPALALQILTLYQDQQFFDFNRNADSPVRQTIISAREREFTSRYESTIGKVAYASLQAEELKRKMSNRQPDAQEAKRLAELEGELRTASDEFRTVLKQAEAGFSGPVDDKDKVGEVSDLTQMQSILRQVSQETGQKATAIYILIGRKELHALIVTPDSLTSVSTPIRWNELSNQARQLWALLQATDYDPTKLSNDLYNIIFKPLEDKLPKDTKTIVWSLDGNLRYIPMAALYDGKQYLVERFNHVVFTRADKERLTRPVSTVWTGYGFATSTPRKVEVGGRKVKFDPLDFVQDEMQLFRTGSYP